MLTSDALIVGGGPAGSSCARALRQAGLNVVVVDRARFPRDKVCAGWVTPDVFRLLDLEPSEYAATGLVLQPITGFRVSLFGAPPVETRYRDVVSYGVRRCEWDDFLLRRARVQVSDQTPVTSLRRANDKWIVNEAFQAPVLIGAGGHFCPVARHLRGDRDHLEPVVAQEVELRLEAGEESRLPDLPELFFCADLDGYAWSIRKGNYLNVGIGRRHANRFSTYRDQFAAFLEKTGRAPRRAFTQWRGHAYFARGAGTRCLADDGVLTIGDSAGLAYPSSGEGIRPAIESGLAAADAIIRASGRYSRPDLEPYETAMRRRHPPIRQRLPAAVTLSAGRAILRSRTLTRHLVLDRWFLQRQTWARTA